MIYSFPSGPLVNLSKQVKKRRDNILLCSPSRHLSLLYCTRICIFFFALGTTDVPPFRAIKNVRMFGHLLVLDKTFRRSAPTCAHLLQPINQTQSPRVCVRIYGIYRCGSALTACPPTLPNTLPVSPLFCHRREPILLPYTPSFSYS